MINNFEDIFGPNENQNLHNKPEDAGDDPDYNVFQKRGLHFVHINANSILTKNWGSKNDCVKDKSSCYRYIWI